MSTGSDSLATSPLYESGVLAARRPVLYYQHVLLSMLNSRILRVMWKIGLIAFLTLSFIAIAGTEFLRSHVRRIRERDHPVTGTQGIAMWGSLITGICLLGTFVCGIMAWLSS
ncbi:hypothetical protein HG15A2_25520 [Adhaeretor mobilis]|uniref:Uncharacterized protein n=1 Tax=Adhaeretor mobilis TaxID=1930276 RepID=A0A517MWI3_9BACT|nr:hypothetical protein HG15A2_25520 [Adhaeretor mobilis]